MSIGRSQRRAGLHCLSEAENITSKISVPGRKGSVPRAVSFGQLDRKKGGRRAVPFVEVLTRDKTKASAKRPIKQKALMCDGLKRRKRQTCPPRTSIGAPPELWRQRDTKATPKASIKQRAIKAPCQTKFPDHPISKLCKDGCAGKQRQVPSKRFFLKKRHQLAGRLFR